MNTVNRNGNTFKPVNTMWNTPFNELMAEAAAKKAKIKTQVQPWKKAVNDLENRTNAQMEALKLCKAREQFSRELKVAQGKAAPHSDFRREDLTAHLEQLKAESAKLPRTYDEAFNAFFQNKAATTQAQKELSTMEPSAPEYQQVYSGLRALFVEAFQINDLIRSGTLESTF
jgi:chromosome segregation ATPase